MEHKKYSSYAAIENDLQILKLEREIYYQKILFTIDKAKENILPTNSLSFIEKVYKNVFSGTYGTILKIVVPYIINWYLNRKRGE